MAKASKIFMITSIILSTLIGAAAADQTHSTLSQVIERGLLRCGVSESLGLALQTPTGRWEGFLADQCRALAAAVLKNEDAIDLITVTMMSRFDGLRDGDLDVSLANVTWTLTRETTLKIAFTAVTYYDGQAILVRRSDGIGRIADLVGRRICVVSNSTNAANIRDINASRNLGMTILAFNGIPGQWSAFLSHQCDAMSNDSNDLYRERLHRAPSDNDLMVLPELISREPLSPIVRADDEQWLHIVRWLWHALVLAEEKGVTKANVKGMMESADIETRRLLGSEPGLGKALGLDDAWAARAISAVGNYGEMFERNFGQGSVIRIDRGLNRLWRDGGLLYAPPMR